MSDVLWCISGAFAIIAIACWIWFGVIIYKQAKRNRHTERFEKEMAEYYKRNLEGAETNG